MPDQRMTPVVVFVIGRRVCVPLADLGITIVQWDEAKIHAGRVRQVLEVPRVSRRERDREP